jgi:hypothetical protein
VNPGPFKRKDRALQNAETRNLDCTLSRDQHYAIRDHATLRTAFTASHLHSDENSRIRASTPQGIDASSLPGIARINGLAAFS